MVKTLCDWDKRDRKDKFEKYAQRVAKPGYICMNCGRAAGKTKWLCDPRKIERS
jgi:hypothetical protein